MGRWKRVWAVPLACSGLAVACASGSNGGPAGGDDDDDDVGPPPEPPVLLVAEARQEGRFGDDVRLTLVGSDVEGDAPYAVVTYLDGAGRELALFDDDGDGVQEATRTVSLDPPIVDPAEATTGVRFANLRRDLPDVAGFRVALEDASGLRSATFEAEIVEQPVLALDALCDPTYTENRCADGLGCREAVPSVCVEGAAPSLERVAYYVDDAGVRVLVQADDPDDDVTGVAIEFFDAAGDPLPLDLDGDGVAESTEFPFDDLRICADGTCFFKFEPSAFFGENVASVAVVATDAGERASQRLERERAAAPVRASGAACDPHGFDVCRDSVCSPGTPGATNRCVAYRTARTAACGAAEAIVAGPDVQSVRGVLAGPSLWDPPTSCASQDPRHRPEGLVKVVLEAPASRLVLSTNNTYTSFDSIVYAFAGCDGAPVLAWCADDTYDGAGQPWLARVELTDVPAGTYFVVVDAFDPGAEGRYQLDVRAE